MGKVGVNDTAAFAISPRMARTLADRWRLRILEELSVRPLSPSQFVELVGGELAPIGRCFRQLADWGYIEILETKHGGHRRGGVEHVYRRIQRALFTTEVWERLPQDYREESTGSGMEAYIARISEAIEAGTFDDELDRHLSWDGYTLDRIAWTELVTRLDEIMFWLPDLSLEAAKRMATTGEDPIPTTVGLSAFRSPTEMTGHLPSVREGAQSPRPEATPFVIDAKTAKALANEWRSRILMELRVRPLSATQFLREFGGDKSWINRCFRQLAEWDYIEVIDIKSGGKRRGGREKFYRLKQRAFFDTQTWERLPRILRDECTAAFLHSYFARVDEAIAAGTFDAEVDRHFTWDGVALDRVAWTEVMDRLDEVLAWCPKLEKEALNRIEKTGEEPIPTTNGLAAFRSPKSSEITTPPQRDEQKND